MRLSILVAVAWGMIAASWTVSSSTVAQQLTIPAFPADAVIRGEDIRLRTEPTAESSDIAVLQRGDAITVTGESTRAAGEEFFPITVVGTGAAGWVIALAVDPRSITAAAPETVEVAETVETVDVAETAEETPDDRAAAREARRAAREANAEPAAAPEPAPAPEVETAETEVDSGDPTTDRAARRAARQAEAETNASAGANRTRAAELTFNGSEPTVTDSFAVPSGVLTVTATHDGDGNFSVLAYSPDGYEELLFNEIGPFNGQSALEIDPETTLILDVEANGAWEVVIEPAF
jgi:hypothetical protein